jgi:predicted RNA methylase
MVNFYDQSMLEVGCGKGRLTWCYADSAAHVMAIDPDRKAVEIAQANIPKGLEGGVSCVVSTIEDFAESVNDRKFDIAIFSWSL